MDEQKRHEENLFTNRGNFFLVGESMLFAGVATLRAVVEPSAKSALPAFYGLGIFLTIMWLLVNVLQHSFTRIPLEKLEYERPWLRPDKSWWWMGFITPLGW